MPERVSSVSIAMSRAFIKGVGEHLPKARATFDVFQIVAQAFKAFDTMRRQQKKTDPRRRGTLGAPQGTPTN
jgi:transposase